MNVLDEVDVTRIALGGIVFMFIIIAYKLINIATEIYDLPNLIVGVKWTVILIPVILTCYAIGFLIEIIFDIEYT